MSILDHPFRGHWPDQVNCQALENGRRQGNWPLITIRPASADDVAKQVEVKTEEHEHTGFELLTGKEHGGCGNEECESILWPRTW